MIYTYAVIAVVCFVHAVINTTVNTVILVNTGVKIVYNLWNKNYKEWQIPSNFKLVNSDFVNMFGQWHHSAVHLLH